MSRLSLVWKEQSFRPPSATGSLSLAGPRESNQREWPEDPTLPRAVTSGAIFRQGIRVLSKHIYQRWAVVLTAALRVYDLPWAKRGQRTFPFDSSAVLDACAGNLL